MSGLTAQIMQNFSGLNENLNRSIASELLATSTMDKRHPIESQSQSQVINLTHDRSVGEKSQGGKSCGGKSDQKLM